MNCEIEATSVGDRFKQFKGQAIETTVIDNQNVNAGGRMGDERLKATNGLIGGVVHGYNHNRQASSEA